MDINDCWIPFRYVGSSANYVSYQFTIWMKNGRTLADFRVLPVKEKYEIKSIFTHPLKTTEYEKGLKCRKPNPHFISKIQWQECPEVGLF